MITNELIPINSNKSVISSSSRFNFHAQYRLDDGTTFIQTWKPRNLPEKPGDTSFVVSRKFAYRPDLISYRMYGTPLFAWAVCYFNNILNPLDRKEGLYAGRLIKIPNKTTLYATGI